MNTLSGLRHRTLSWSVDLVGATIEKTKAPAITLTPPRSLCQPLPFRRFPTGICTCKANVGARVRLREMPQGMSRSVNHAAQRQMHGRIKVPLAFGKNRTSALSVDLSSVQAATTSNQATLLDTSLRAALAGFCLLVPLIKILRWPCLLACGVHNLNRGFGISCCREL